MPAVREGPGLVTAPWGHALGGALVGGGVVRMGRSGKNLSHYH